MAAGGGYCYAPAVRWNQINKDPNDAKVMEHRAQVLRAAEATPVADRLPYLTQLAAGKRVLDVGVVNHTIGQQHSADWLHGAIASVAASILGVDVLPEAVSALQSEGYNVRLWDITEKPLDAKFELIVVGKVIEHLGSPGALFASASQMLVPEGRLVLTTPNPYYASRVRDGILQGFTNDSVDHVTLLSPGGIAEFAERAGLRLDRWRGVVASRPRTVVGRIARGTLRMLPVSAQSFCNTLIYECVPEST